MTSASCHCGTISFASRSTRITMMLKMFFVLRFARRPACLLPVHSGCVGDRSAESRDNGFLRYHRKPDGRTREPEHKEHLQHHRYARGARREADCSAMK